MIRPLGSPHGLRVPTRTAHRMIVALEDAGLEIRDCIPWITAQGFPKSKSVSLAMPPGKWADFHARGKVMSAHAEELGRYPSNLLHNWSDEVLDRRSRKSDRRSSPRPSDRRSNGDLFAAD
jgi:hypothetical protein